MLAMHSFGAVVYRSSRSSKRGRRKVTRRHEILIPLGNVIQLRPRSKIAALLPPRWFAAVLLGTAIGGRPFKNTDAEVGRWAP